jgi:hypothetical protein
MSIAAVDQRLMAMLEELERGMSRSRAIGLTKVGPLAEMARPVARHEDPNQIIFEPKGQLSAQIRAVAIVIAIGGLASLTVSLNSWTKAPNPSETVMTNSETELVKIQAGTATGGNVPTKDVPTIGGSALSSSIAPVNNAEQTVNASRAQGKAPSAVSLGEDGGLSIDAYNLRVRQLLAKVQAKAARSVPWPEMGTAMNIPAKPAAPANLGDQRLNHHAPIANKAKARATASVAKSKRAKAANKRAAPIPAPASTGPIAFIQGATEALTGVVKDWGRIATGSRP